jgi:hypothetical protein
MSHSGLVFQPSFNRDIFSLKDFSGFSKPTNLNQLQLSLGVNMAAE